MHHHFCWGWVARPKKMNHVVHPSVAALQHYKRCRLKPDRCRKMMNDTSIDDNILKYREKLIRAVSQKLAAIYK